MFDKEKSSAFVVDKSHSKFSFLFNCDIHIETSSVGTENC